MPNGKGKMHVVLFKNDTMVHLMERVLESLPISHETKEKIRAVFKSHQAYRAAFAYPNEAPKNKSWIGLLEGAGQAMLKVTADVVYGSKYDGNLKLAVRGGKSPAEACAEGALATALAEVVKTATEESSTLDADKALPDGEAKKVERKVGMMRHSQKFNELNLYQ